jgi:hypothetical protein
MSSADLPVPPPASSSPIPVPLSVRGANRILRLLWTSNPFYVISAGLFLLGLKLSFSAQSSEVDSWALMGGLGGYTLLLAAAALVLVRFARVWNDVRTVLLLVVLMFLATSVTFDELLVMQPQRGQWFFIGGLVFSIALTEGLLRGIRLRLPLLFRLPYHLILALFFLYPLVLVPVVRDAHSEDLMWRLWGFAPAAGLVFLTLLPAVRHGREYLRDNGSPWPWPFYPWSLFVFLAVAVYGRAFLLCRSFHLLPGYDERTIFGPYFMIPFGFALVVLLLEIGIVARNRAAQAIAIVAPLGLAVLAALGHEPDAIYNEFLSHFQSRLGGTPLYIALLAAGLFYLYAWVRRVPLAPEGSTVVLVALAFVRPETLALGNLGTAQPAFLASAVLVQMYVALWRWDLIRAIGIATFAIAWLGSLAWRGYRELRETVPGLDYIAVSLVLLPVAVLISLVKGGAFERRAAESHGGAGTE